MSSFDPQVFLDAQQSEVNEKRALLPTENPASPDGLYLGVCGEPKTTTGEKDGKVWVSVLVPIKVEVPPQLREGLQLPETLTYTHRCFLDLTPGGTIDNSPGKNRQQKAVREALDMNKPGDIFSWRKVTGQPLKVKIEHHMYNQEAQDGIGNLLKA